MYTHCAKGTRGSVVGWGIILQAGRSLIWFPVMSFDFQTHSCPGVGSASNRNEYQESSWRLLWYKEQWRILREIHDLSAGIITHLIPYLSRLSCCLTRVAVVTTQRCATLICGILQLLHLARRFCRRPRRLGVVLLTPKRPPLYVVMPLASFLHRGSGGAPMEPGIHLTISISLSASSLFV
jgi:hypothetical protein